MGVVPRQVTTRCAPYCLLVAKKNFLYRTFLEGTSLQLTQVPLGAFVFRPVLCGRVVGNGLEQVVVLDSLS